jgi:hypothetical protein
MWGLGSAPTAGQSDHVCGEVPKAGGSVRRTLTVCTYHWTVSYTFDTQKCQLGMASRCLDAIVGISVYQHALIHDRGYWRNDAAEAGWRNLYLQQQERRRRRRRGGVWITMLFRDTLINVRKLRCGWWERWKTRTNYLETTFAQSAVTRPILIFLNYI